MIGTAAQVGTIIVDKAIVVPVHYTVVLDYIILLLDFVSGSAVLWRLFAYDPVKNATLYRIALAILAGGLYGQCANIIARQWFTPFNADFQSIWALPHFGIFAYIIALVNRERRAKQILPSNEGATDFKRGKTNG